MNEKVFSVLVGALAIALIVVGCGSSEPDPLTKAEFIKQGNAICVQAGQEREAALKEAAKEGTQGSEESSEAELDRYVTEVALPPIQKMTDELDGLGAPKKDEKQVEAIVAGFEEDIEKLEADPHSALGGDPFTGANKLAAAYGLTECKI